VSRRIKHFGGQQETLPIKDKKQLDAVMRYLRLQIEHAKTEIKKKQAYRNYMIFLIGLNTAFRAEDLLQLRVKEVEKGYVSIKENKTGKMQNFRMNKNLHNEIIEYIDYMKLTSSDYLFMGQKTKNTYNGKEYPIIYPVTRQNIRVVFKKVAKNVGIDFKFGLHSLRKTFGYMYILNGGNVITLMKMYNHDSPDVTLVYVHWGKEDAESDREAIFIGGKK
jgi:integrase